MRRSVTIGRGLRACACGLLLAALAAGCGQTIPGTPHAEGEGPSPGPTGSSEAAPPTAFQEPSGRPTVTVQPDETAGADPTTSPLVPGPLPAGPPSTGSPAPGSPAPGSSAPPLAAAPTEEPRATSEPGRSRSASPSPRRSTAPGAPPASGSGGDAGSGGNAGSGGPAGSGGIPGAAADAAPLTADVVADECLLDAAGFAALLGGPVGRPTENVVTRADGSRTRSCYATSRSGSPAPTAAVNVYRVNRGTPAAFVRSAAGGRPLAGVGEAAVLLDTVGGTTMQVATARYLVTVNVVDGSPPAERWVAAGRAVVDALGRG